MLARQRPGVRSIRIEYGSGRFHHNEPRRFRRRMPLVNVWRSQIRLRQQRGHLVLDLPGAARRPSRSVLFRCGNSPG